MGKGMWMDLPLAGGRQWVTPETHPVSWAYFVHGSDLGGNMDQARAEYYEQELRAMGRRRRDWHRRRDQSEPDCAGHQWRTRDRYVVVDMTDMDDNHLGHAIRFASTKPQHSSRLAALVNERARRRENKDAADREG
jgi:hypothetical protein